jgi:transglutaminase-like putative cysteine protease
MDIKVYVFRLFLISAVFGIAASNANAGDLPSWMRHAASGSVPSYEKDVPAVVLHDEQQVSFDGNKKLVTTENYALKILTREGRGLAIARAFYLVSSGKVRDIDGWLIRPDGSTKHYDKKAVLDIIADTDDVYNEGRVKIIDASRDVDTGYVFGYTIVTEDNPLFYQDIWNFQGRLPTLVSRYSLSLPSGWQAGSITFNHPEVKPVKNGNVHTWDLRNLPPIPAEPMSPSVFNIAPRIVVNYGPPKTDGSATRTFADWTEVSRWASLLHDPQVILDDNIAAKARDLTANAETELDKIRAIGHYVQNLQYISIDIGVGYGNGYKPRPSSLVLGRGYGDCKDKANLMRALLRAIKIEAYPIAIYSGDPAFVRAEWASPRQFNHCIIAVKVSDATKAATILNHEKLGRLLIFDATDPYTPVGDLPDHLQGSLGLIAAGDNGGLSRMPVTPSETDLLERNIEAEIGGSGEIRGTIRERARGQASTLFRREFRESSAVDYRKGIESWLTSGATGAKLDDLLAKEGTATSTFRREILGCPIRSAYAGPPVDLQACYRRKTRYNISDRG